MEHITENEFVKQPKKVQKVFLDWWQKNISETDLVGYIGKTPYFIRHGPWLAMSVDFLALPVGEETVPLFTEGQLRRFIENKIGKILKITYIRGEFSGNKKACYKIQENYDDIRDGSNSKVWTIVTESLLQAYWQVACELADKEAKGI